MVGQMKITAFLGGPKASPVTPKPANDETAENDDPKGGASREEVELASQKTEIIEMERKSAPVILINHDDSDDENVKHFGHKIRRCILEDSDDSDNSDLVILREQSKTKPAKLSSSPSSNSSSEKSLKRKTTPKREKSVPQTPAKVADGIIGMKVRSPNNSNADGYDST